MSRPDLRILRLARTGSTQDEARRWIARGCRSGTVVVADEQVEGRGRRGKRWLSPPGLGIWLTYVHRPARPGIEWPAVTLLGALAICDCLEVIGLKPRAKWPNDILLSGRKVAGVLADVEGVYVLLGIGINVLQEEGDFPEPLRGNATSIRIESDHLGEEKSLNRESLLIALGDRIRERFEQFDTEGPAQIVAALWTRSSHRDHRLLLELPSGERREGIAIGLGDTGELRLQAKEEVLSISTATIIEEEEA